MNKIPDSVLAAMIVFIIFAAGFVAGDLIAGTHDKTLACTKTIAQGQAYYNNCITVK